MIAYVAAHEVVHLLHEDHSRAFLEHSVRLRLSSRSLPLSGHETRSLLDGRDIAELYEVWTHFAVVEAATFALGPPAEASRVERGPWGAEPDSRLAVRWRDGTCVRYQASFTRRTARRAYAQQLSPDVVIELPDGAIHILDAKFRLDRSSAEESGFLSEDLVKMHAYRDAIDGALTAWETPRASFHVSLRSAPRRKTALPLTARGTWERAFLPLAGPHGGYRGPAREPPVASTARMS